MTCNSTIINLILGKELQDLLTIRSDHILILCMHYVGGADTEDQQKNHVSILKYTELLISQLTYQGWGWIIKKLSLGQKL